MKWALTIAAILFGLPLLTLLWLVAVDGKVLFVRNPNNKVVSVQVATQSGFYTETTDPRSIAAGALTWIVFDPQVKGESGLLCTGQRGTTRIALSTPERPMPMFSKVTLDSCEGSYVLRMPRPRVIFHRIVPPQPLN